MSKRLIRIEMELQALRDSLGKKPPRTNSTLWDALVEMRNRMADESMQNTAFRTHTQDEVLRQRESLWQMVLSVSKGKGKGKQDWGPSTHDASIGSTASSSASADTTTWSMFETGKRPPAKPGPPVKTIPEGVPVLKAAPTHMGPPPPKSPQPKYPPNTENPVGQAYWQRYWQGVLEDKGKGKGKRLTPEELAFWVCLLYTSPSPRDRTRSRMPSSA